MIENYVRMIWKRYKMLPTWLPGNAVSIGMIGRIEDSVFTPISSLQAEGIQHGSSVVKGPPQMEALDATITRLEASASAVAGTSIKFTRRGGFVFRATDCTLLALDNQRQVEVEVGSFHTEGIWQRDWRVVTKVVRVGVGSLLLCETDEGSLDIDGQELAIAASVHIKREAGSIQKYRLAQGSTPLFTVARFRPQQRFFGGAPKLQPTKHIGDDPALHARTGMAEEASLFEAVDPDEYLGRPG